MKITRLLLNNIRCFDELELQFDNESALIVGDNGDGKSTVLRSLAMGLCDHSSAAALFRELPGEFIRTDSKGAAFVQVDLSARGGWRYRIQTNFIALATFERIEQTYFRVKGSGSFCEIKQDQFPWSRMFVSGYGPGIRTYGDAEYSAYRSVDAVYSLFRYDAALQSPELAIRRLVDEAGKRNARHARRTLRRVQITLKDLLDLKRPSDVQLTRRGIFIVGPWGREQLAALGDGYRATTTWTLDLMSWWLLYDEQPAHEFDASSLTGIVFVDELEQHLHPRWQRTILPQLRAKYENIQFIVATHSPLVASSCPDVTVYCLENGQASTHVPFGWRAEDVYQMMGVSTSRAASFQDEIIAKFTQLDETRLKRKLSPAESKLLLNLRSKLDRLPPNDPARVAIELHNMVKSLRAKN